MTTPIDADLLMAFIQSEAEERAAAMKPEDAASLRMADEAYLNALASIVTYILHATGRESGRAA